MNTTGFIEFIVYLSVGVLSLALRWHMRRLSSDGVVFPATGWLGACANFHLFSALIFYLTSGRGGWLAGHLASDTVPAVNIESAILFMVFLLIGFAALILVSLALRLDAASQGRFANSQTVPWFMAGILLLGGMEAMAILLERLDIGYAIAEGSGLLACLLMAHRLMRLLLLDLHPLNLTRLARLMACSASLTFLAQAVIAALHLLQTFDRSLWVGPPLNWIPVGGLAGATLFHLPELQLLYGAWSGLTLLLLAWSWRTGRLQASVDVIA